VEVRIQEGEAPQEPESWIERLFYVYAGAMMLLLLGVVLYVVFARYYLNRPPIWGEDVPRLIFLWGVLLSAPLAIVRGANIRVTAVDSLLPPLPLKLLRTVLHLIVLSFLCVIVVNSVPIVQLAARGTMLTTGLSNLFLRLPITVGGALMFMAQAWLLVQLWREPKSNGTGAAQT